MLMSKGHELSALTSVSVCVCLSLVCLSVQGGVRGVNLGWGSGWSDVEKRKPGLGIR